MHRIKLAAYHDAAAKLVSKLAHHRPVIRPVAQPSDVLSRDSPSSLSRLEVHLNIQKLLLASGCANDILRLLSPNRWFLQSVISSP
jgi:hypothetical protein